MCAPEVRDNTDRDTWVFNASYRTVTLFSVLDQAPTRAGSSQAQAVRDVERLARHVEPLGYHRFWIAEHHALGSVASTAPEVLIGHVASRTQKIRVGSGGILLPNHRPLHVAELFRVLAALHPGRIDLGVGRSEGATDEAVQQALDRPHNSTHEAGYEHMLEELLAFADVRQLPAEHALASVRAGPGGEPFPPVFVLGSSTASAHTAAAYGLGYGFAAYTRPDAVVTALRSYRARFVPALSGARPHAILGLRVIVGEDEEHARGLAASSHLAMAQARAGSRQPLLPIEQALAHTWTEAERAGAAKLDQRADVTGDPARVAARIAELVEQTAVDEVIVTTNAYAPEERFDSYTRLAEAVGIGRAHASVADTDRHDNERS